MATAQHIINRALQKIEVKEAGIDLTDDEYTDAIDQMNDLFLELDSEGVQLGYTIVSVKTDQVTIPRWADGYIKAQLALDLASEYGYQVKPSLIAEVDRKRTILDKRVVSETFGPVRFPEHLPTGSSAIGFSENITFGDSTLDDVELVTGETWEDDDGTPVEEDAAENLYP